MTDLVKLTIYFKNGTSVTIDNVSKWVATELSTGGKLGSLTVKQENPKVRLVVKSLDLNEINCITETK